MALENKLDMYVYSRVLEAKKVSTAPNYRKAFKVYFDAGLEWDTDKGACLSPSVQNREQYRRVQLYRHLTEVTNGRYH